MSTEPGSRSRASRRVTGIDVAKAAGVSRTTVSYVLNGNPRQSIPEATRRRILDAAERLGYIPDVAARALRTGQRRTVLLSVPDLPNNQALTTLIEVLADELAQLGYVLVTHLTGRVRATAAALLSDVVPAAVIAFSPFPAEEVRLIRGSGVRLVVPSSDVHDDNGWVDWIDWGPQGELQADLLVATGRHRLGLATPTAPAGGADIVRRRKLRINAQLHELGLPPVSTRAVPAEPELAADAMRQWFDEVPDLDGVCAYDDVVAAAVMHGAQAVGRRVPQDLGVVGAGDLPFAALLTPALTTVRPDNAMMAVQIAQGIADYFADGGEGGSTGPHAITVRRNVELIRRDSA